jgi:hypothetical protein
MNLFQKRFLSAHDHRCSRNERDNVQRRGRGDSLLNYTLSGLHKSGYGNLKKKTVTHKLHNWTFKIYLIPSISPHYNAINLIDACLLESVCVLMGCNIARRYV